jgi:hypothetical protein
LGNNFDSDKFRHMCILSGNWTLDKDFNFFFFEN